MTSTGGEAHACRQAPAAPPPKHHPLPPPPPAPPPRYSWIESVLSCGSAASLRYCLGVLESCISRDYLPLSLAFPATPILVKGAWVSSSSREVASALPGPNGEIQLLPERCVCVWGGGQQ